MSYPERKGGVRTFRKMMISRKNGTSKNSGVPRNLKNHDLRKKGHPKNARVLGNSVKKHDIRRNGTFETFGRTSVVISIPTFVFILMPTFGSDLNKIRFYIVFDLILYVLFDFL